MNNTTKIYPIADQLTQCRYMLRINQIPVINAESVRGTPVLTINTANAQRAQTTINYMQEQGLIY